ncbi:hypothetical protein [Nonomuraea helvata]|uniref:Uncharacterized protein n=1 Tax=Nonomuraea helvata TaxID=37484 RepID=A0ABV5S268_9ACTN
MRATSRRSPAFTVALTLFACLLAYLATPNLGTVVRAARADGTPGVFVPRELFCIQHPGHESCVWTGDFRSDDGAVSRSGVEMYGSDRTTHRAGQPARAVDVGAANRVYGPGGSNEWIVTALLLASAAAILLFLYVGPRRGTRRPRVAADRE